MHTNMSFFPLKLMIFAFNLKFLRMSEYFLHRHCPRRPRHISCMGKHFKQYSAFCVLNCVNDLSPAHHQQLNFHYVKNVLTCWTSFRLNVRFYHYTYFFNNIFSQGQIRIWHVTLPHSFLCLGKRGKHLPVPAEVISKKSWMNIFDDQRHHSFFFVCDRHD